jgi:hypothetical protein
MYNTNLPSKDELPSNIQLIKATVGSAVVALVLLITCILPAEYAVDPTGLGKAFGLMEMGEIKIQLENEAQSEQASTEPQVQALAAEKPETQPASLSTQTADGSGESVNVNAPFEVRKIVLKPTKAAELKLIMKKGTVVSYEWSVDKGHVNYDTHGDNASTNYHGYGKGKAVKGDQGMLEAAFDGKHGWFWRNRSKETTTITLKVEGDFSDIERVL